MQKRKPQKGKRSQDYGPLSADMIQGADYFMIHDPSFKGNALSKSAGTYFWVLGSVREWSHCLSYSSRVSRYHHHVQSCLHLVNGWHWHDPTALPVATNDLENISWILESLNATVVPHVSGKSLPFWMTHSACWAHVSLQWGSVARHNLQPWVTEAPRYKMEIVFYRKTVFSLLYFS